MSSPKILIDSTFLFPLFLLLVAVMAVGWWWWRNSQADRLRWFQKGKLGEREITVVLAMTGAEVQQGLSDRKTLGADAMFFQMQPRADHRFWMYHMQFPLDFVWVFEGKVVALHENVPAPTSEKREDIAVVEPRTVADGVLELPAGTIAKEHIRVGDPWLILGERSRRMW